MFTLMSKYPTTLTATTQIHGRLRSGFFAGVPSVIRAVYRARSRRTAQQNCRGSSGHRRHFTPSNSTYRGIVGLVSDQEKEWVYEQSADASARFVLGTVGHNPLV